MHTDSESKNGFDNSTSDSKKKKKIDGNSTEIEHILNHEMFDNSIKNILWETWDSVFPQVKKRT